MGKGHTGVENDIWERFSKSKGTVSDRGKRAINGGKDWAWPVFIWPH